jgi:hypothetical protein
MTIPTPRTESPHDVHLLTLDLHLADPREVFVVEAFDPFVPDMPMHSGIEQIKAAALSMKLPEQLRVTLYLPEEKVQDTTMQSIRAALTRFCTYQGAAAQAAIAARKRQAIGELKVGAVVFAACLVVALLLLPMLTSPNPILATLGAVLGGALVIALWVVVWAPIESFFVEPLPFVWEQRFIDRLRDMQLVVRAEPAEPPAI